MKAKWDHLNIMELVFAGYWDQNRDSIKYSGPNTYTSIATDKDLKVCTKCNKVWEIGKIGAGKYTQFTYDDFPRYGKGKDKCAKCRLEDNESFFNSWDRGKSKRISFIRFQYHHKYKESNV